MAKGFLQSSTVMKAMLYVQHSPAQHSLFDVQWSSGQDQCSGFPVRSSMAEWFRVLLAVEQCLGHLKKNAS